MICIKEGNENEMLLSKIFKRRTAEEKRISKLLSNSNAINTTSKLTINKPRIYATNVYGFYEVNGKIKKPLFYE